MPIARRQAHERTGNGGNRGDTGVRADIQLGALLGVEITELAAAVIGTHGDPRYAGARLERKMGRGPYQGSAHAYECSSD